MQHARHRSSSETRTRTPLRRGGGVPQVLVLCALALLLVLALAAPAQAATRYARTIRDGRAAARDLLAQTGAPSLSLALVSNGRVVWRQSFGYADVEKQVAPTPETMYGLGSVSKTFAAAAVMRLVDDGVVSLDAPLAMYLPAFRMASPGYRSITVRMLLDHSSGLPGTAYGSADTPEYWPGYLDVVMASIAQSRLKHTPGMMSVYCNDGFTLVEELVPAVTGKSYPTYVQDAILSPLGMTHTAFPLYAFADGTYAKAYSADGTVQPREVLNLLASGGLYSTPTDMARFATMLMAEGAYGGARILSPASVAEMGKDQTVGEFRPCVSNAARFGLGWDSVTYPGLKKVGVTAWAKGGDSDDYHTGLIVAPRHKLAVVVLGTRPMTSGTSETLGERILLHALVDRGVLRRMPRAIAAVAPRVKTATASQLRAMEGYWAESTNVFKVGASPSDPQELTLSVLAEGSWDAVLTGLRLRTDGTFHQDGSAASVYTATGGGRRYLIYRDVGGMGHYLDAMPWAQKLAPDEPLSAVWASRLGRVWLAVNESPESAIYDSAMPLIQIGEVPGLPGSLTVLSGLGLQVVDPGESDELALMFLQIPGFGSRDLNDVVIEERGGEEWMRFGSTLCRPLEGVPALPDGVSTVTTGGEGYAEWRSLGAAARVTIDAGARWRLYDAGTDFLDGGTSFPAEVDAPAGAYLCLFAPAGSSAAVTVEPVVGGPAPSPQAAPVIRVRPPSFGTPVL